jgi:hypothetical protein
VERVLMALDADPGVEAVASQPRRNGFPVSSIADGPWAARQ